MQDFEKVKETYEKKWREASDCYAEILKILKPDYWKRLLLKKISEGITKEKDTEILLTLIAFFSETTHNAAYRSGGKIARDHIMIDLFSPKGGIFDTSDYAEDSVEEPADYLATLAEIREGLTDPQEIEELDRLIASLNSISNTTDVKF